MNNPPAFPCNFTTGDPRDGAATQDGMTLHDYYKGQAMAALITNMEFGGTLQRMFDPEKKIANAGNEKESPQDYLVRVAAAFADAMLADRQKRNA